VAILLALAVCALALHEEQTAPARMLGMGSAVVAAGGSVCDVPFNPALTAEIDRPTLSGTYSMRWSLDDFREYSAVFGVPMKYANLAVLWHERSVVDVYGERTVELSVGRNVWRDLSAGVTAKLLITSAPGAELWGDPAYNGPTYTPCFDFGLLYALHEKWRFGLATRSFGEPEITLLEAGTEGEKLGRQIALGSSWEVAPDLILAADLLSDEGNLEKWSPRFGMEIKFFETVSVRAGAKSERLGMGAGLEGDHWAFDFGLLNHRWLGNIYRFTMTLEY